MNLLFKVKLANAYKSNSQKIRVMSEDWVGREIFCPACGGILESYENGRPVNDFFCVSCKEDFELKSKKDTFGKKIVDGSFKKMIEKVQNNIPPNFFLMNYNPTNYSVTNFFIIPKHFFVPEVIEQRKPLSLSAMRPNWIGCNILLKNIPQSGKIFYIKNSNLEPKSKIFDNWNKTLFLKDTKKLSAKGWILDVMSCVDKLDKKVFNLDEVYAFEMILAEKYPNNKHIKDKIRQQLQLLRDKGFLSFIGRGRYKLN